MGTGGKYHIDVFPLLPADPPSRQGPQDAPLLAEGGGSDEYGPHGGGPLWDWRGLGPQRSLCSREVPTNASGCRPKP
eukprot:15432477-Alexandrium_andersonii.AAC.1